MSCEQGELSEQFELEIFKNFQNLQILGRSTGDRYITSTCGDCISNIHSQFFEVQFLRESLFETVPTICLRISITIDLILELCRNYGVQKPKYGLIFQTFNYRTRTGDRTK